MKTILGDFPNIPEDFPDPQNYYSDDILSPTFYEWHYLKDVGEWFKNRKEEE